MVEFAGWTMPVEYAGAGLRTEHAACRQAVGLFDVSHMGEIRVKGEKALDTVQWLTTNNASRLANGQAQYSLLPNTEGGLVDDIIVYCVEKGHDYLICVNASNTFNDFAWMTQHNRGAEIIDESGRWGQIAVQGPRALALTARLLDEPVDFIARFEFRQIHYGGDFLLVARTGYTGEDGVELFVPAGRTVDVWDELMDLGREFGAQPVGLGARDTLRTEMGYPLYGHEISARSNPYSAGLGWVIKPEAKDFIGRDRILAERDNSVSAQRLIGFKMVGRGIPRPEYSLWSEDGRPLGRVTSGTLSPTLDVGIGLGYVPFEFSREGTRLDVEIRGRRVEAQVVTVPFVKRS